MKKMGGKKADGLSNVNYNEIQKTILHEVYTIWAHSFASAQFIQRAPFKRKTFLTHAL